MSKQPQNKEQAKPDFIQMIRNAWTVGRMTQEEQTRLFDLLQDCNPNGTYWRRWDTFNVIFHAFLDGLGYDGPDWREPEPQRPRPLF